MKNDTPPPRKKIFCVDDDPEMLALMTVLLEDKGIFEVRQFTSACGAIEAMMKTVPDVVLLDVIMPDIDGIAAYRKMRENRGLRYTKIAFVTGRKRPACLEQYMAMRVPILKKPFTIEQFQKFLGTIA